MDRNNLFCSRTFLCLVLYGIGFVFVSYLFTSEKSFVIRILQEKTRATEPHHQAEVKYNQADEMHNQSMRLYSAFIDGKYNADLNYTAEKYTLIHRQLIVIAWQFKHLTYDTFKCCILLDSANIFTSKSEKANQCCYGTGKIRARRIVCQLDGNMTGPIRVSLAKWNQTCPQNKQYYIQPTVLEPVLKKNQWALCNKYLYGPGPDAKLLVQWFEIHRFLGVDKFTIHHEATVNSRTKKVLKFYQEEGFAEVLHIDAPYKETINRHDHKPRYELWNDEQVGLWDCRQRNKYYEFSSDIDTDEFILPEVIKENASKTIIEDIFRRNPVGVIKFYSYIHLTSWEPTDSTHPLLLGQYENSTEPLIEAPKNMYMPSRISIEDGTIHTVNPKIGFRRISPRPSQVAVHHIRPCRPSWNKPFRTLVFRNGKAFTATLTCNKFSSVRPVNMKGPYIERIEKNVQQVYEKLGI